MLGPTSHLRQVSGVNAVGNWNASGELGTK